MIEVRESLHTRVAAVRALTTTFMTEHGLPFTIAEDLLSLVQRLAQDKQALEKATMSATSAT